MILSVLKYLIFGAVIVLGAIVIRTGKLPWTKKRL